ILLLANHHQPPVFQILDPVLEVTLGGRAPVGERSTKRPHTHTRTRSRTRTLTHTHARTLTYRFDHWTLPCSPKTSLSFSTSPFRVSLPPIHTPYCTPRPPPQHKQR